MTKNFESDEFFDRLFFPGEVKYFLWLQVKFYSLSSSNKSKSLYYKIYWITRWACCSILNKTIDASSRNSFSTTFKMWLLIMLACHKYSVSLQVCCWREPKLKQKLSKVFFSRLKSKLNFLQASFLLLDI